MVSLIILSKNRHLIDEFVGNPAILPADFVRLRNQYWEKMFAEVKKEFLSEFKGNLSAEDKDYLEKIHMLAHAQVSRGKSHMFYRPADWAPAGQPVLPGPAGEYAFAVKSVRPYCDGQRFHHPE
jgi:hypothetical protein